MMQKKFQLFILISFILIGALYGCQSGNVPAADVESVSPTPTAMPPTATEMPDSAAVSGASEEITQLATVIVTVVVTNTPQPVEPTEAPAEDVPAPTATPQPPEPTATPLPEPTATPIVVPGPAWLTMFNKVRDLAHLPHIPASAALTTGSQWHSRYMVVNDEPIAHKEDINNPLYDEAGDIAAINGNIFATSQTEANYEWGINFWVSAPFHLVPMLHPRLQTAGYGDYVEAVGDTNMAAVMDVRSEREGEADGIEYPIFFPADGSSTWVVRHSLFEWPDPIGSCPGFSRPAGAPIVVQFGDGSITPNVSSFTMAMGSTPIEVCMFNESTYRNSNAYAEGVGRTTLDGQDAVVLMPRQPLAADAEYTVQLVANGETYTWSFKTIKRPPAE